MAYIALDHVEKLYHVGEVTITAVSDISFTCLLYTSRCV